MSEFGQSIHPLIRLTFIGIVLVLLTGCAMFTCPIATSDQSDNHEFSTQTEFPVTAIPGLPVAAEAYFSPDGKSLICNARVQPDDSVHHVYTANIDGSNVQRINSQGEDACSFFFPDGRLIYTSTKDHPELPAEDWSVPTKYPQGAELYACDPDGSNEVRLTDNTNYEAEVSLSPDGKWILFSRQIDGNLDLWRMRSDGSNSEQITHTPDWQEGGAFYMPDNKTVLFRAWKREHDEQRAKPMALFTIRHDGSGLTRLTHDGGTNWAPYPHPNGRHCVFTRVLPPHNFEIFLLDMETGEQTRLTHYDGFDGFPVVSPDGKKVMFSSSRGSDPEKHVLSLFIMDISSLALE